MNVDHETAVDPAARRKFAEAIRHLACGQITNDEFLRRGMTTKDKAIGEIAIWGVWPFYDDLFTHKLEGRWALSNEGKAFMARIILFLRSDQPYRGPLRTGLKWSMLWLVTPVVIGWQTDLLEVGVVAAVGLLWLRCLWNGYRHRKERGEYWPFCSQADYETALAKPVYLRGLPRC